jgi:hypothetical protein
MLNLVVLYVLGSICTPHGKNKEMWHLTFSLSLSPFDLLLEFKQKTKKKTEKV